MTRAVFATRQQAESAVKALDDARRAIAEEQLTIGSAAERFHLSHGPTSSDSCLQRWLKLSTPTICATRNGFYLKVSEQTNRALQNDEELVLLERIKDVIRKNGFLRSSELTELATSFREQIVQEDSTVPTRRKVLMQCKFGPFWVKEYLQRHKDKLRNHTPRHVDNVRYVAFNAFTVGSFFAQVSLVYQNYKIRSPSQVFNLDETGFSPGRDVIGMKCSRVITEVGASAVTPKLSFNYTNRVSIIVCVCASGTSVAPGIVFKGVREPTLSSGAMSARVTQLVKEPWSVYWRRDTASVDSYIFGRWIDRFIAAVRTDVDSNDWAVLFYDALRAHMTSTVVEKLYKEKVAVVALPAHTSDRMQPLDVSVFGPMKQYTVKHLSQRSLEMERQIPGEYKLTGIELLDAILHGYEKSITIANITSGFQKSGIWPLNAELLCTNGIRESSKEPATLTLPEFEKRLHSLRLDFKRFGPPRVRIRGGFVDTEAGLELTRDDVRDEIKALEEVRSEKRRRDDDNAASVHLGEGIEKEKRRKFSYSVLLSRAMDRARRHGGPVRMPRSMQQRRLDARLIQLRKQQDGLNIGTDTAVREDDTAVVEDGAHAHTEDIPSPPGNRTDVPAVADDTGELPR